MRVSNEKSTYMLRMIEENHYILRMIEENPFSCTLVIINKKNIVVQLLHFQEYFCYKITKMLGKI